MLTDAQRETLVAACDTIVPSLERADDPDGFFARPSSATGAPIAIEQAIAAMPAASAAGMAQLLDALGEQGFARASRRSREQLLTNVALSGPLAAVGVGGLVSLTLFFTYGLPGPDGKNANWARFGYPGPLSAPPQRPKPIEPLRPTADSTLECDVCVVGSGAGGGVIAGVLAQAGLDVVVLEAGGYVDDADFMQLEIPAYMNSFWRGGPTYSGDLNISIQAGACLGGGTVINWTNSLRTTPWVREQWEQQFGLDGLAGSPFDAHLDAVWERISVTGDCSELNGAQQRMRSGAQALGWSFRHTDRNTDPSSYDFKSAGYLGFGDQSGSKRSTAKTYLVDAFNAGARILVNTTARRVTSADAHATGVQAIATGPDGSTHSITVRARNVVVACGSLESPALLLRSGIGGPAAGDYLRLHPCTAVIGYYGDDLESWQGPPHAGLVNEFADVEDGHGFLIEGAQYTTAVAASAVPFVSGEQHKELMSRFSSAASFIGLLRDHGHGRVVLDENGEGVPFYSLHDELDLRNTRRAIDAQVRLHAAAGAAGVIALAAGAPTWHPGENIDRFIARIQELPLRAGGWRLFSAHQMGSCRMGSDPQTSVADPTGELHDTKGVWVGDASAFPTASGTNPMITTMALAHRTAHALAAKAAGGVEAAAAA